MFRRIETSYEVWYDLKTFDNRTLTDQHTPGVKKSDAKELRHKYQTNPNYQDGHSNVRIVKVRKTLPRWLNR